MVMNIIVQGHISTRILINMYLCCLSASLCVCVVFFQGYEGVRESLNSKKKSSALTVKSVDSNMNKKSKKKKEEEVELPSKKQSSDSSSAL